MSYKILQGHVLDRLRELPDNSVHCVVTSPPYYGLRDYGLPPSAWGDGWVGCLGLEPTPAQFIAHCVEVFAEVRRVLRPDGTCWVNMGDSYASAPNQRKPGDGDCVGFKQASNIGSRMIGSRAPVGFKPKDLMGMPWRFAFALQDDGWWLRQDIIWSKPNTMPESVTDRCTKAHEYLFLLTKSARYFYDAAAIKEPANGWNGSEFHDGKNAKIHPNVGQNNRGKGNAKTFRGGVYTQGNAFDNSGTIERDSRGNCQNQTGKRNKRSVWEIATEPFLEAHFATFPTKLVEPCIRAGCPVGGVVLDHFNGSGTTGVVAIAERCDYIGIELNLDYVAMSERRLKAATAQEVMVFA